MDNKPLYSPEDQEVVDSLSFIKEHEGFKPESYLDHNKHETIGHGIRTDNPRYQEYLTNNPSRNPASGKPQLSEDQSLGIVSQIMNDKKNELKELLKNRASGYQGTPQKNAVLNSLIYQSNNLLGPHVLESLNKNDDNAIAGELLFNSNPKNMPGVLQRRLDEAKMYMGDDQFMNYLKSLGPAKAQDLIGMLQKTKDEQKRNELLQKHSYLNDIANPKPQIDFLRGLSFLKGK